MVPGGCFLAIKCQSIIWFSRSQEMSWFPTTEIKYFQQTLQPTYCFCDSWPYRHSFMKNSSKALPNMHIMLREPQEENYPSGKLIFFDLTNWLPRDLSSSLEKYLWCWLSQLGSLKLNKLIFKSQTQMKLQLPKLTGMQVSHAFRAENLPEQSYCVPF